MKRPLPSGQFFDSETILTRSFYLAFQNELEELSKINGETPNNSLTLQLKEQIEEKARNEFDRLAAAAKAEGLALPEENTDVFISAVVARLINNSLNFPNNFFSSQPSTADTQSFLREILSSDYAVERRGPTYSRITMQTYEPGTPISFAASEISSNVLSCYLKWEITGGRNPVSESHSRQRFFGISKFYPNQISSTTLLPNNQPAGSRMIQTIYRTSDTQATTLNFKIYKMNEMFFINLRNNRDNADLQKSVLTVDVQIYKEVL